MLIDNSLSRGFAKDFIRECDSQGTEEIARFSRKLKPINHYRKWGPKLVIPFKENFKRSSIWAYEGGGRRHPYLAAVMLASAKHRLYKDWTEDVLFATPLIFGFDPWIFEQGDILFNVGEHAIRRLYMRSALSKTIMDSRDVHCIAPELSLLALWTSFWTFVVGIKMKAVIGEISLVIPAKTGIFLGEFNVTERFVEIRTFVGDDQLTPDQLAIKNVLLKATGNLSDSPLSSGLALLKIGYEQRMLVITCGMIAAKLIPHIDLLARVFNRKLGGFEKKRESKILLGIALEEFSTFTTVALNDSINAVGYRKAEIIIRNYAGSR